MTTTHQLTDLGYSVLAQGVPSGPCKVDVWSRVSAEREGWDYLVSLPGAAPKTHQVLNLDSPFDTSPNVVDIGKLLVKAKALKRKPGFGYEYAINVNDCNDFEANFAHENLRNRAIDELILLGQGGLDDNICCFEIKPNGDQPEQAVGYVDVKSWVANRDLAGPLTEPASQLRMAILVDDTETAEAALKAGASPSACSEAHPARLLALAAMLGRDRILAAMREISPHFVEVDAPNPQGDRALHLAAEGMHRAACVQLLLLGASVGAINDAGSTPVDVAVAVAGNPVTDLLLEAAQEAIKEIAGMGLGGRP